MSSGSLRLRIFAGAAISIALALFLTGVALVQLFERQVRARVVAELENDLLQLVGVVEFGADGKVSVKRTLADPRFGEPYSGRYWRIDFAGPGAAATRQPMRSRSLWDADLDPVNPQGPEGEKLVVVAREISLDNGGKPLALWLTVAAHDDEVQRPLEQLRDQLVLSLGLIGSVLTLGAWIQATVGLSPLVTLRHRLADVSSGEAQHLTGEFPSEVAPLVNELNAVLEMREKSMERARRRAGDLAHGLKTPLTVLSAIARDVRAHQLDRQAAEIDEQAGAMYHHVERALARARLSSGRGHAATGLGAIVDRLLVTLQRLPEAEDLDFDVDLPPGQTVLIEASDLTELLGNLLDNACKWARSQVRVRYAAPCLTIEDDGPGVPDEDLETIAERGRRLDESKRGSGLGLSIVGDIADIYGLQVVYGRSSLGGLKVEIRV